MILVRTRGSRKEGSVLVELMDLVNPLAFAQYSEGDQQTDTPPTRRTSESKATGSWHTWVLLDNNGGASNIRRNVLACLHATWFLYYSVVKGES